MTIPDVQVIIFRRHADGRTWTAEPQGEPELAGCGESRVEALRALTQMMMRRAVE